MAQPPTTSRWSDEQLQVILGNLLRTGVLTAAAVVLLGGILYLARHGAACQAIMSFEENHPTSVRSAGSSATYLGEQSRRDPIGTAVADRHARDAGRPVAVGFCEATRSNLRVGKLHGAGVAALQSFWRAAVRACVQIASSEVPLSLWERVRVRAICRKSPVFCRGTNEALTLQFSSSLMRIAGLNRESQHCARGTSRQPSAMQASTSASSRPGYSARICSDRASIGQQIENERHPNAVAANTRLAETNIRVDRDSRQQVRLFHGVSLPFIILHHTADLQQRRRLPPNLARNSDGLMETSAVADRYPGVSRYGSCPICRWVFLRSFSKYISDLRWRKWRRSTFRCALRKSRPR